MSTEATTLKDAPGRPPQWIFKYIMNPLLMTMLRSPLHGRLSQVLMVIHFTGRRSGKRYATPVAYHRLDERNLVFFTHSNWWKNLRNGQAVTLRLRGRTITGTPEPIEDFEQALPYVLRFLEQYGRENSRRIGLILPPDATDEDVRHAARGTVVVKVHLQQSIS